MDAIKTLAYAGLIVLITCSIVLWFINQYQKKDQAAIKKEMKDWNDNEFFYYGHLLRQAEAGKLIENNFVSVWKPFKFKNKWFIDGRNGQPIMEIVDAKKIASYTDCKGGGKDKYNKGIILCQKHAPLVRGGVKIGDLAIIEGDGYYRVLKTKWGMITVDREVKNGLKLPRVSFYRAKED